MMNDEPANQPTDYPTIRPSDHPTIEPLVEVTRGSRVESMHAGAVAVVDAHGRLVAHAGDPDLVTYLRSTAKPFQLLPLLESGGADRFGFTGQDLAVIAASHSGEPRHVEAVQGILDKIGLSEEALQCGAHWPMSDAATRALRESGREPTPIYHNCSGKHAGMLAQAVHRRLSTHDYLDPHHPVQVAILETLAEMSGVPPDAIDVGIDGCSAPCFAMPLRACALAFARLADPSALPGPRPRAVKRMVDAMIAFPEMVGGERRLDTDLMRAARGGVLSKGGAEGYHGMAILSGGLGIAIKIADGNGQRGCGPVAIEALRQLGALGGAALEALGEHRGGVVRNHRGLAVGEVRAVFELVP